MKDAYHTHIIRIGNSRGIRIPKRFLKGLGDKIVILPSKSGLVIQKDKAESVAPREEWNTLFANAISAGNSPEGDPFNAITNEFDEKEWTWD